jgi:Wzt C-terminal domain
MRTESSAGGAERAAAERPAATKFRRVVLHVGGDKTGSTAIQMALDGGRDLLIGQSLAAYPPGLSHAELGSALSADPTAYPFNAHKGPVNVEALRERDRAYLERLRDWIAGAPQCPRLVFSYEGFKDLDVESLARMRGFCSEYAGDVQVVFYVRAPLSFAASAMSQRVKFGFKSFPAGDPPISPYKRMLSSIVGAFGKANVVVRQFAADALKNGDVVDDFLGLLEIPESVAQQLLADRRWVNESLSEPALIVGDALIDELSGSRRFYSDEEFFERYGKYLASIPGGPIRLTRKQALGVKAASQPHTTYLQDEFGIRFEEKEADYLVAPEEVGSGRRNGYVAIGRMMGKVGQPLGREDFESSECFAVSASLQGSKAVQRGASLCFEVEFSVSAEIDELEPGIHIHDEQGRVVFGTNTTLLKRPLLRVAPGRHVLRYYLVADWPAGRYTAGFAFAQRGKEGFKELCWYDAVVDFSVSLPWSEETVGYAKVPVEFDHLGSNGAVVERIESAAGSVEMDGVMGDARAGESFWLPVRLRNASGRRWTGTLLHPINLAYRWVNPGDETVALEGEHTALSVRDIEADAVVSMRVAVLAPEVPGRFRLVIMPVQEGVFWFDQRGFVPATLDVVVVGPESPRRYPATDARLRSSVGIREGRSIKSTGKAGALMFGPYAQLPAGGFVARLEGRCDEAGSATSIDVACETGNRVIARREIEVSAGVIGELEFELEHAVNDLEVRVWVSAESQVCVDVLSIQPKVRERMFEP